MLGEVEKLKVDIVCSINPNKINNEENKATSPKIEV